MTLKDSVQAVLDHALKQLGVQQSARIEIARDEKFGDYACTSAMDQRVRDEAGIKNPRELATKLIGQIEKSDTPAISGLDRYHAGLTKLFSETEIAGPGFINLRIHNDVLFAIASGCLKNRAEYGRSDQKDGPRILFEFVSANPTGPLNVVSARAAALGDSCCNLLDAAGAKTEREYYVNDYGNQVNLLGLSALLRLAESAGVKLKFAERTKTKDGAPAYEFKNEPGIPFPSEGYHGQYLSDIAKSVAAKHKDIGLSETELNLLKKHSESADCNPGIFDTEELSGFKQHSVLFGRATAEYFLETQKEDLEGFRVKFDNFFQESRLHESGSVEKAKDSLGNHTYEEDGKILFKSTDYGDDKDRVIIRDDGRPTYLLADIAYHKDKKDRGYDKIINIWGPDHHGYIARLSGAMQALGLEKDKFQVLIAQQVNLLDDGEPVIMSKRTGKFITMKTLIEEIPVDVTRYFFVMRSFEAHLDFDFKEASDTSEKNPYYYVAYAHARIRSLLTKAEEAGLKPLEASDLATAKTGSGKMTDERRKLLWMIARFPEEIRDAAYSFEPHRMTGFLYLTAASLSRFYTMPANRILEMKPEEAAWLLAVLDCVSICLKNGLKLLGMEAPERLVRDQES